MSNLIDDDFNDAKPSSWPELHRSRRAVVVVDVVESVRLMQSFEDDVIERWRRFVHEVRAEVLPPLGGQMIKSLGDGLLLVFDDAPKAVAATRDLHTRIEASNRERSAEAAMWLRIGVHVGAVVLDEFDAYGPTVNMAARLSTLATPGGTVASAEARDTLVGDLDADIVDLGECYLKHLPESVRCFRIGAAEAPSVSRARAGAHGADSMQPRVAVLAPRCFGLPREQSFAGELVADALIGRLSASPALRVISRLSSSAVARRSLSVGEAAAQLGANYLLSGVLTARGGRWRCSLELADGRSGDVLWSRSTEVAPDAILRSDDDFSADVAAHVFAAIAEHQFRRLRTQPLPTLEAFALQLSGLALMHRASVADFERARVVLETLVERHPRAPVARAWLAKWWVLRSIRGLGGNPRDEAAQALTQTRSALQEDPDCALALAMQGYVQCHMLRDLDAAQSSLDHAQQANPNEPLAWLYRSVVHGFRGQGDEAYACAETAISLSPLDPQRPFFDALASSAAITAGHLSRGIEFARRALKANRGDLPTQRALTAALAESGDIQAAREAAARVLELAPEFTIKAYVAAAPKGSEASRQRFAQAFALAGLPNE